MLVFTILRGTPEPTTLLEVDRPFTHTDVPGLADLVSPLHAPHIYDVPSSPAVDILSDIHRLSQTFLARCTFVGEPCPASDAHVASLDFEMQQIHARLLSRPPTREDLMPDWMYETCRLAALIVCRSIAEGTSLADSATVICTRGNGVHQTSTTLLTALHTAMMRTDRHACWGDQRAPFLWVCLVGGAASWPSSREEISPAQAWERKCFSLYALKAAVCVPFSQTETVIQGLRWFLQIRHWTDLRNVVHARKG